MTNFLAVFIGTPAGFERSSWNKLDPAARAERQAAGMQAWGKWVETHSSSIVLLGGPLGKTKSVSPDGVADIRNAMAGYVVVSAETHDAAARMFENHPHFTIFPGDSVEVMECLPVPVR